MSSGFLIGVVMAFGIGIGAFAFFYFKEQKKALGDKKKKKSYLTPGKFFGVLAISVIIGSFALSKWIEIDKTQKVREKVEVKKQDVEKKGFEVEKIPLIQAKSNHETVLEKEGPASVNFDNDDFPPGVKNYRFESDGRKLRAWVMRPKGKGKHPAVIYAHDGNALTRDDIDIVKPFAEAGFIVFLPTWRGENGNSGNYEMCYGEVDDAVNAVEYLAKRKPVDGNNIFAIGQGYGATIVMLLAESTFKVKKAAACGGYPDMVKTGAYDEAPFKSSKTELYLRSPARYLKELNCPLKLYYGEDGKNAERFIEQAKQMAKDAEKENKKITVKTYESLNNLDAMKRAVPEIVEYFSEDLDLNSENTASNANDDDDESEETAETETESNSESDSNTESVEKSDTENESEDQ